MQTGVPTRYCRNSRCHCTFALCGEPWLERKAALRSIFPLTSDCEQEALANGSVWHSACFPVQSSLAFGGDRAFPLGSTSVGVGATPVDLAMRGLGCLASAIS